jgi:hypothetical protein
MWQLTLDAWVFKSAAEGGEEAERFNAQSRLQRHVVRVVRSSVEMSNGAKENDR